MRKSLSAVIRHQILNYNLTPFEINNGFCEEFAKDVIQSCPELKNLQDVEVGSFIEDDSLFPGHIWIFDGSKHYDAEAPEGVENWRELPIFKRAQAIAQMIKTAGVDQDRIVVKGMGGKESSCVT